MRTRWILLAVVLLAGGCSRQEAQWREARAQDSPAAYQAYLIEFPAGRHGDAARARLREMAEDHDWQRALRLDTPESLQRYLAAYPSGRHAARARQRLAGYLQGAAPAAGPAPAGWSTQLGAFGSRAAADAVWQRLGRLYPALLAGREPALLRVVEGDHELWRLRVAAAGEDDARELCARLVEQGEACAAALD